MKITRHRRLVGRAYRRKHKGVPVTSRAVVLAYAAEQRPGVRESFQAVLHGMRAAWATIRDTFQNALRGTREDFALVPPLPPAPVRRRPDGPLIHNGRKPR